jgi:hypothetical protein
MDIRTQRTPKGTKTGRRGRRLSNNTEQNETTLRELEVYYPCGIQQATIDVQNETVTKTDGK